MQFFADLHLHSRFSRATSKDLTIPNLEKYARIKGIGLLGTGDCQHPGWNEELKKYFVKEKEGIYYTETGFPFILSTEISLIYSDAGKGRRVHLVVLLPSFAAVDQLISYLKKHGRLDYDGRPIFNIPCDRFVADLKNISDDIEIIPAHIWTPWFSLFGSKSGYDSLKDCFKDQAKHIHAYETGLSSDPPMNWRISELDNLTLVSFSDLHSYWPWRIGREATIFDIDLTYKNLLAALRTRKGYVGTIEVDPCYGKYHFDGHRSCNVSLAPAESLKLKNICPVCRRPLTVGVLQRVEELAEKDRPEGYRPKQQYSYYSLISLSEIISLVLGKGVATKEVWKEYYTILKAGKDELDVLLNLPYEKLKEVTSEKISQTIIESREGKMSVKPGYDGVYGVPLIEGVEPKIMSEDGNGETEKPQTQPAKSQKGLGDFF
ncbi:MAG: endonuclease Q family protein [Nanoarchaeota archaeon]